MEEKSLFEKTEKMNDEFIKTINEKQKKERNKTLNIVRYFSHIKNVF